MADYQRVARIFAGSTQIFPAWDVLRGPEPTIEEYRAAMKVQIIWAILVVITLSSTAMVMYTSGDGLALRLLVAVSVLLAIAPQALVVYYRLKTRRESKRVPLDISATAGVSCDNNSAPL